MAHTGKPPEVIIIGGGFAGLRAARALRRSSARVTLIDRCNHHLFQPLLYQVATATLSPAQIAAPIRRILSRQRNCRVLLGEVEAIDTTARTVHVGPTTLSYDYLIVCAGVGTAYFGHDAWKNDAPGLKTVDEAIELRRRFLLSFETAERETDEAARKRAMTFVVIGGGPTGVEMAGAMSEIARRTFPGDFRAIDPRSARVVLVEGSPRVLAAFPEDLSARALRDLQALGVEVRVGTRVVGVDPGGVDVERPGQPGRERIESACVVWAAGVRASPLGAMLVGQQAAGTSLDRAGRVLVQSDLSVPGHPNVFVAGDLAAVKIAGSDHWVPGVAPGAMQMGSYAGAIVAAELAATARGSAPPARRPFKYVNRGELATIGRNRAVGVLGFGLGTKLTGFIAWALWAMVHVTYLIGFRNRVVTMLDWAWSYVFFSRGARLITGDSRPRLKE